MSYSFDGSQWLHAASCPFTNYPFSLSCWIKDSSYGSSAMAMGVSKGATSSVDYAAVGTAATGAARYQIDGSGVSDNANAGSGATGAWVHVCLVCSSSTSRSVYRNGGDKTSDSTSVSFAASLAHIGIGGAAWDTNDEVLTSMMSALVAEAAFFDDALSDGEVALLYDNGEGAGTNPADFEDCVLYYPMEDDLDPAVGATTLTASTSAPTQDADHPTIAAPTGSGSATAAIVTVFGCSA